jgi:hypothetical protein
MATKFRGVRGGTPSGEPLCRNCRHANYQRGDTQTAVVLRCGVIGKEPLTFERFECPSYSATHLIDIDFDLGWAMGTDKHGNIRFVNPNAARYEQIQALELQVEKLEIEVQKAKKAEA